MAFRIDPQLPVDAEIRRVLDEQLRKAAQELRRDGGPDAEAVHDARKRIKKARSTLRLARADLGAGVVRHANAELREVGASLAAQREADALVESVDKLAEAVTATEDEASPDDDALVSSTHVVDALGRLRVGLAARADAVRGGAVDPSAARSAARRLELLATWIDRVPPHAEGWKAIGPGLARQHRRGHQAREVVLAVSRPDQPAAEDLHNWRKRVKDLWYHERLLRRLWTEAQAPWLEAASELADVLGDDHDLALLVELLEPAPPPDESAGDDGAPSPDLDADLGTSLIGDVDRDLIVVAASERRAALQARARHLGALLYAEDADAWEARHRAWWRATA